MTTTAQLVDSPADPRIGAPIDFERAQSFMSRVMNDLSGAVMGLVCAVGDRLGLFQALAASGACTSEQLAHHAGVTERYAREWLHAVASAGYVEYDAAGASYRLPPEHALVIAHERSPMFLGGGFSSSWASRVRWTCCARRSATAAGCRKNPTARTS